MASIYKRKNDNGTTVWRAVVRIKGYPSVSNHFERKQEAEDWALGVERQIKLGQFKFDQHNQIHTFAGLMERYLSDGALEHHRSAKDTLRHLNYWKSRLASYALVHITPELVGKERQILANSPSAKGKKRTSATINRYMASLSLLFGYAVRQLHWLAENPCASLTKLKENAGRDRILSHDDPVIEELQNLYQKRQLLKPLVFASRTAFGRIDIKKAWQTALTLAGIEKCRAHDMRHTFATLAAAQGASNLELATAMGHRTLQMLQRYTHLDVQITKKFSKHISEQILQEDPHELNAS